ncbi:MAG TPA: GNAT family N-acetyltransferase [Bacteroidales bacterium]|nr:GNAT family N-acetyltransferase [Bacteroidales bacterium]
MEKDTIQNPKNDKMEGMISPVSKQLIMGELTPERFVRKTSNASNHIYVVNANNSPNIMREIGRLRELSFRVAGGGTGKPLDIDAYDTGSEPYEQLIVWDPASEEIVGGYRFTLCRSKGFDNLGAPKLATSKLFHFSGKFIDEYLPYTIELGRSFVQPVYQSTQINRKSIYALDNLWDGLGTLVVDYEDVRYFFGKVTMYPHFNVNARDLILYFLSRFYPDPDKLVHPFEPLTLSTPLKKLESIFTADSLEENFKLLTQAVRKFKENVPPLFSSYSALSSTMKTFGTALNKDFGGVEETGILITISDIYEPKRNRYVGQYLSSKGLDSI